MTNKLASVADVTSKPPSSQQPPPATKKVIDLQTRHGVSPGGRTVAAPTYTTPKEAPNPNGPPPAAPSTPTAALQASGSQKSCLTRSSTSGASHTPAYSSPYAFRKNSFAQKQRAHAAGLAEARNESLKQRTSEREGTSSVRPEGMIKSATTPRVIYPTSGRSIQQSETQRRGGSNGTSKVRSSSTPRVTGQMPGTNNESNIARSLGSARGKVHANGERLKSAVGSDAPAPEQRESGNLDQDAQTEKKPQEAASKSDVFSKLYKDALVKNIKMDNLRAKIASAERRRASSHGRPPGSQSARRASLPDGEDPPGHRLYFDAERKKRKFQLLRLKQDGINARKEMEELTLSPEIKESQKHISGIPSRVGDFRKLSDKKMNAIRQELDQKEMQGCTFKPSIDVKSQAMMELRISRLQITGTLHDHLYEDAKRREGRYAEYARQEPTEATFHPDIGYEHWRSPNDDNRQDFLNRLAYSKTYREKNSASQLSTECDFKPRTGRGPSAPRNKERLPIGLFLYEKGIESMNEKRRLYDVAVMETDKKSMSSTSKEKFNDAKKRKFESIFLKLSKGKDKILPEGLDIEMKKAAFEPDVAKFLEPIVGHVIKWNFEMNFEQFEVAMNYTIGRRKEPLAHLFTDRTRKVVPDFPTFTPRLAKKSEELAKNRPRDRSLPLYEQLCAESEVYEKARQQRVHERAEELLKECTFQPNNDRMATSRSDPGLRRKPDKFSVPSDPALTSITANRDVFVEVAERNILEKRNNHDKLGFQEQVDLAEAAVRRCRDVVTKAKSTVYASFT